MGVENRKIRVLIVEDEPLALERIKSLVEERPELELVELATDGQEALRKYQTARIDLAFLDIGLPGLTGFQVVERMEPEPYVIFITGSGDRALEAFEMGAIDYITKPITKERFERALSRALSFFSSPSKTAHVKQGFFVAEQYS